MISNRLKLTVFLSKVAMNRFVTLSTCKLVKKFKKQIILNNISINFKKGATYALTGESGSGKSTFMHVLAGLDSCTAGKVSLDKRSLDTLNSRERAQAIGFVVQTPTLISELTVLENSILSAQLLGLSVVKAKQKAQEYLEFLDLMNVASWHVGALSGGQRQRVALVRTLITEPDFLLADEPTGNLDDKNSDQLIKILLMCQKKWNMGLIVSTHCKDVAQKMEVVFTLKNGILVRTS
ncbi:MAG: ABC-type lipoprotein export system ATPase subunit [Alteromonas naphthalenivorans]|jgi:ABC-type lipoprotein export system ATPase subunit